MLLWYYDDSLVHHLPWNLQLWPLIICTPTDDTNASETQSRFIFSIAADVVSICSINTVHRQSYCGPCYIDLPRLWSVFIPCRRASYLVDFMLVHRRKSIVHRYQMGRAAWSRFALLRGGKSGTATRALGAVSAISFGWKVYAYYWHGTHL